MESVGSTERIRRHGSNACQSQKVNCSDSRTLLFICNVAWFFISHRIALAKAARDQGYDVHVACDVENPAEIRMIQDAGIHFHRIPLHRGGLNPLADLRTFVSLLVLMWRYRPALVHNVTIKPVLYGSIAAHLLRVRGVVNAISGLGYVFVDTRRASIIRRFVHRLYRIALYPRSVHVIFQNKQDREHFVNNGLVTAEKTTLIAGSGVDTDAFRPVRESLEPLVRVVLPARMLADKGVREFCRAANILRSSGLMVDCVLAGGMDSANPAALSQADIRALESSSAVRWLGHVIDMQNLLRSAHIVCLPSYREGLPKALIEACAMGRPIVTTAVPGCSDVVENGVNGLLVPPRDAVALAEALARLVKDPHLRSVMGARGRQIAVDRFGLESVIRRTLGVYDKLLAAK